MIIDNKFSLIYSLRCFLGVKMHLISFNDVYKINGDKELFSNVTLGIRKGEKIALIGINGTGKSTFLNLVAQKLDVDGGEITTNNRFKFAFLEQNPVFSEEETILDYLFSEESYEAKLLKRYEETINKKNITPEDLEIQAEIMEEMEKNNVWSYESKIREILNVLSIHDLNQKMGILSGGMIKKVALTKTLLSESNMMILDEPTNHLDIESIIWLQGFLKKTDKAVLMVTHDRYFLEEISDTIFEIDERKIFTYNGNYSYYLDKRAVRKAENQRAEDKLSAIMKMELKYVRQGAKARTSKNKLRMQRYDDYVNREKIEAERELKLEVTEKRLGNTILEFSNISKSFGEKLIIKDFSYKFKPFERVGIIGENGTGKTTFINILTEELNFDLGEIKKGINTKFSIFSQDSRDVFKDLETRVIDFIKDDNELIELKGGETVSVTQMLEKFLFPKVLHYTPIKNLSGGERRRLHLLKILLNNPNFLILDEPTNDLDINTLAILEDFLENFKGNILVVSHDRYFMDKIVDNLFIFKGNGIIEESVKSCSEYFEDKQKEKQIVIKKAKPTVKKEDVKKKLSYNEKKELESIEEEIEMLEIELENIENRFSNNDYDIIELPILNDRYGFLKKEIEKKFNRWEELEDIKNG
jgi:ATP-binding cassette subfamily F protein uup